MKRAKGTFAPILICLAAACCSASNLEDLAVVTNEILVIELDDGWAEFWGANQTRNENIPHHFPIDRNAMMHPSSYVLSSPDDPAYAGGKKPVDIGCKSKGDEFCNGTVADKDQEVVIMDHHVYLLLPSPLRNGSVYELDVSGLSDHKKIWRFRYDFRFTRSEAVHANQVGYIPASPQKYAYISQWMGTKGPLGLDDYAGTPFHLVDVKTGASVFQGTIELHTRKTNVDYQNPEQGNYAGADVFQCDFSAFTDTGEYVVAVENFGCSYPFLVHPDAFRDAHYVAVRGLWHQRSGIDLTDQFTRWPTAADYHGIPQMHGWYHDAGDWDSYDRNLVIPQYMLLAYLSGPEKFRDGELKINESGNGIPDCLDEAAWMIKAFRSSRKFLNGLVTDGRIDGDDQPNCAWRLGCPSWEDTQIYEIRSASRDMTMVYAGLAGHMAYCLSVIESPAPGVIDSMNGWLAEAKSAYDKVTDVGGSARVFGDVGLYRATGDEKYHASFKQHSTVDDPSDDIGCSTAEAISRWAYFSYALLPDGMGDAALKQAVTGAIDKAANRTVIGPADRRSFRNGGGKFSFSMWLGHLTTPISSEGIALWAATQDPRVLGYLQSTADFYLGANPINMCWVAMLGDRWPREIHHNDTRFIKARDQQQGLVPFGPALGGDWNSGGMKGQTYAYTLLEPDGQGWPICERWTGNWYSITTHEFTTPQNIAPNASLYSALCSDDPALQRDPNMYPSISIAAEAPSYGVNQIVPITADAIDTDGYVTHVDYYANRRFIGRSLDAPFTLAWEPASAGTYTVEGIARDNLGEKAYSDSIAVVITAPVQEEAQPPAAPVAPDALILSGASVRVSWQESSDNTAIAGYHVYQDGVRITPELVGGTTLVVKGLGDVSAPEYIITSVDVFGNESELSAAAAPHNVGISSDTPRATPAVRAARMVHNPLTGGTAVRLDTGVGSVAVFDVHGRLLWRHARANAVSAESVLLPERLAQRVLLVRCR